MTHNAYKKLLKIFLKKFEKKLDKIIVLCYNSIVDRERVRITQ